MESKKIIKSLVNKERSELLKVDNKIVAAALATEKNQECIPTVFVTNNSPCPVNEECVKRPGDDAHGYECMCPHEENMRRIDGVCREYLPNTESCMMYLNECDKEANEECVVLHTSPASSIRSRHGTCQCRVGFTRDSDSSKCKLTNDEQEDKNVPILLRFHLFKTNFFRNYMNLKSCMFI